MQGEATAGIFITDLLRAHAAANPESPALAQYGETLTYGELDRRAEVLAGVLHQEHQIGPGAVVGISLERGIVSVVAICAAWKAGAAYVYMDPRYPLDRCNYMLHDSGTRVLISSREQAARLDCGGLPTIYAEDLRFPAEAARHAPDVPREALAYVMYTSGSSGKPKGVLITRGNVADYAPALNAHMRLEPTDTYLHTASFSFSSSVRQLIMPLAFGTKLLLADATQVRAPVELLRLVKDEGVTVMDIIPSHWNSLIQCLTALREGERRTLLDNQLRLLVSASEPLPPETPATWRGELGYTGRLINMYGQTETTGIVTMFPVEPGWTPEGRSVAVGKPIQNATVYLLDESGQRVPQGEAGEICFGGTGVGLGYLHEEALTAEKFVSDPFREGGTMYRTGDLGRLDEDGNLVHLGRRDHQVKVRGYRIELGEVESALRRCDGVGEAVVKACRDDVLETRLVGYVVPEPGAAVSAARLRKEIGASLPEYMVPAEIMTIEALPRTPNGKVDRSALPEPRGEIELDHERVAPRTDLERTVAGLWQQVLALSSLGVTDDFFELGGSSLAAVRMLATVQGRFGVEYPPSVLLEAPTVEALCQRLAGDLEGTASTGAARYAIPMTPECTHERRPLFMVHGALGNVLNLRPLARRVGRRRPFVGIQAAGLNEGETPGEDLVEMAANYLGDVRSIQPDGPYLIGGFCAGGNIAIEMAHQLEAAGEQVELLVLVDAFSNVTRDRIGPGDRLRMKWQELCQQGPAYLLAYPLTKLREWTTPTSPHATVAEARSHAIHMAYRRANARYAQRPYAGRVLLFRPPLAPRYHLGADRLLSATREFLYPDNGWRDDLPNLRVVETAGDHDSQVLDPDVDSLAAELIPILEELA